MSSGTGNTGSGGNDGFYLGPHLIQQKDFFQKDSILHPLVIGSIALIFLFSYLRLSSNRCVAPMTIFDWLVNVALGSTLAGIVNGNSLVRGLVGLCTLLAFQFITSHLSSHHHKYLNKVLMSPPLIVIFRGQRLEDIMRKHRISQTDLNGALRQRAIINVCLVEVCIIEPTGAFSIFTKEDMKNGTVTPDVLLDIKAYRRLCAEDKVKHGCLSPERMDEIACEEA